MVSPIVLARLLAEPERVRVFAAVALGAATLGEVARQAGTSPKETVAALHRLLEQGVVVDEAGGLRVNHDLLKDLARGVAETPAHASYGYEDDRVEAVLRTFVRDGRLVRLPAQWTRKKVILHHIAATAFERGAEYTERQVNDILKEWCDGGAADHVSLRRYLVDLQLLRREEGVYWVNPVLLADAAAVLG
jgi:hypothetical protein